jgi:Mg-chelatase subunit ChlD
MTGELAQAQAGIHDVMDFAAAAAGGMRVAVVGYRDHGDEWTTRWWDFTGDKAEARARLWRLRADGGGDDPELVHEGLKIAYGQFAWRRGEGVQRVLVLVGDAPPQPGFGGRCVELARAGLAAGITTYVISTRDERREEEVKHFPEIARAGGGRVIRLAARRDLAAELAGVALADTWHDPVVAIFERYLILCR